jgi:acetaldehyde dehydrogenase (acetylating)
MQSTAEMVRSATLGQRLKAQVFLTSDGRRLEGIKATTLLEVEGAAHYLPAHAGNLNIMTSAGLRTAEKIAARKFIQRAP